MAITPWLAQLIAYHVNDKDFGGNGVVLGLLIVFIRVPQLGEAQDQNDPREENIVESPQ